jgi:hypothetical protein
VTISDAAKKAVDAKIRSEQADQENYEKALKWGICPRCGESAKKVWWFLGFFWPSERYVCRNGHQFKHYILHD